MDEIEICFAELDDLPTWMDLVRAARADFPGLETEQALSDYQAVVVKNIKRQTAVCAKAGNRVVGALLYSKNQNTLSFLAVDPAYRKQGIASALIRRMLDDFVPGSEISVTTYRAGDPKGAAARPLYQKLGFVEGELVEEFGYPCQKFYLRV